MIVNVLMTPPLYILYLYYIKDSRNAYHTYRVPAVNLTLYIFGPTSSHIYPTGQNEVPVEPQRPNEDAQINHS